MTQIPCVNHRRFFDGYELLITARKLDSNSPDIYTELIVRTVKLWLYLAKAIQNNMTALPDEIALRSVESSIEQDTIDDSDGQGGVQFDDFNENRVTIFDWNHKLEMTLHSNSLPQSVLDLYWAMHSAKQTLATLYPITPQNDTTRSNSSATLPQATTTSKAPENAQKATNEALQHNHDAKCYTRKEALDEFESGAEFSMQICKIMKRSQDGNEYYEFYHKYGQNPGKFAELRLYADNEVALKNGLMDSLDALALKPGQDRLGEWLLKCRVAENAKKGENVVYPLALSN